MTAVYSKTADKQEREVTVLVSLSGMWTPTQSREERQSGRISGNTGAGDLSPFTN